MTQLGLGTVQFGLDYGVSNNKGQVPHSEVSKILDHAWANSIRFLDTARGYGNSEEVLGTCISNNQNFDIVTKIPSLGKGPLTDLDLSNTLEEFLESLKLLNTEHVYGLLLHEANDLLRPEAQDVYKILREIKKSGQAKKIGVSIYHSSQIKEIIKLFEIDLVQVPINIFDQRLIEDGTLRQLKNQGVEIHARSLFLQGSLLATQENLPKQLQPHKEQFQKYHEAVEQLGLTPLQATLGFAKGVPEIDVALVGVTSTNEFLEIVEAYQSVNPIDFSELSTDNLSLINPTRW